MTVSAQDAHPYPIYNARFRLIVPLLDADGDPISPSAPDSELSQDLGTFADATNEATEIATSSGVVYLDLVAGEMDTKSTTVRVQSTGAKTTIAVLNPRRLPQVRTGTAQAGAASTITLDASASAVDDYYNGCWVNITNNSPANAQGQARMIIDYVGSTKVVTIEGTWGTNPSSASTFEVLLSEWALLLDPVRGVGSPTALPNAAAEASGGLYTRGSGAGQINQNANGQVDARAVAMSSGVIAAATFAAGAIDAAAIAADAIGSSELAASAVTEIQTGLSTLDAAGVRTAVGLASANLDTQLTAIDDYIDTEVAAIKAKTDLIPAAPAAVADIPTANANADALLDRASGVETSYTLRQALRLVLAALAGKLSGAASATVTIRDVGDTKNRVVATVDSDGNRSAVTLDVS